MKPKIVKLLIAFFIFVSGASIHAQQITKFGVVDTARVYNAYFRNSAAVRNYEKKKADFQQEINKYTEELQKLQAKKIDYEKAGNDAMVQKIQAEITKKADFVIEYTNAKNVELDSMQKTLQGSDAFYNSLNNTLSKIAEAGGYSMILSLQQGNAILCYSNSVDVTEQVIAELGK